MSSYILTVGIFSPKTYTVFVPISLETGLSLGDFNAGNGFMFLLYSWGCYRMINYVHEVE